MVYTLRFFLFKMQFFHKSNVFGSCIIHILYTGVLKLKKNNSGAKRLTAQIVKTSFICETLTFSYSLQHSLTSTSYRVFTVLLACLRTDQ
jgi:hypothetical protein